MILLIQKYILAAVGTGGRRRLYDCSITIRGADADAKTELESKVEQRKREREREREKRGRQ
jgi:flagellar basal body-associated protein FliL